MCDALLLHPPNINNDANTKGTNNSLLMTYVLYKIPSCSLCHPNKHKVHCLGICCPKKHHIEIDISILYTDTKAR